MLSVIEQMSNYTNLKDNEITILASIEQQVVRNADYTIRTIAKLNFISTSTVFKLVKKLGFSGYSEMIFHIKSLISSTTNQISLISLEGIITNYRQSDVDTFINLLIESEEERICLLGLGFSEIMCDYISRRLTLFDFYAYNGAHLDIHNGHSKSKAIQLMIVISKSGETDDLLRIIDTAHQSNVTVVSFTSNAKSAIALKSDLTFEIRGVTSITYHQADTFSPLILLAFEYILQAYSEKTQQYTERTESQC